MENHPIPQDVTGFKFRLIGSITLKQFLYLLGAGGIDLAIYFLPFPLLLKIPLMGIPAVIALALAFVPIDGRPMDKMIMNFLKALPAENEYIFRKQGVSMPYFAFNAPIHAKHTAVAAQSDVKTAQRALLLKQLSSSYFNADKEEQKDLQNVTALFQSVSPTSGFVNRVINADTTPQTQATQEGTKKPQDLSSPVMPSAPQPNHDKNLSGVAPRPLSPSATSSDASKPAEKILTTEQVSQPPTPSAPLASVPEIIAAQPSTASTTPLQPQPISAPVATTPPQTPPTPVSNTPVASYEAPNVIEGIVKDPRGKPLPHVIVEILDENDIPKRTFRTGQNGMFVSATPMPPGTYTVHLEDTLKKQEFEDRTVVVNGSILPVLEITSVDQREKLRRELFGHAMQ